MGRKVLARGQIPLRRWEEWERSRLRKLKRDEKRRREMEVAFPSGYPAEPGQFLPRRDFDSHSGSSDTLSLASSEEDMWGAQIGGYNENVSIYVPPPTGAGKIVNNPDLMASSTTLGDDDMEALLDAGFDDSPSRSSNRMSRSRPTTVASMKRYTLTDTLSPNRNDFQAYPPPNAIASHHGLRSPSPRERVISPTQPLMPVGAASTAIQWQTHAKKRSAGKGTPGSGEYGPLEPLDPNIRN